LAKDKVREATATYREEMDTLRQFFEECTIIDHRRGGSTGIVSDGPRRKTPRTRISTV
jgi:hypothetical protein